MRCSMTNIAYAYAEFKCFFRFFALCGSKTHMHGINNRIFAFFLIFLRKYGILPPY